MQPHAVKTVHEQDRGLGLGIKLRRRRGLPLGRASRLVESLAAHREEALLYRRLATLRDDAPLEEELAALEWRGASAGLEDLCRELGDEGLKKRVGGRRGASA